MVLLRVWVPKEMRAEVQQAAKRQGMNTSEALRNLFPAFCRTVAEILPEDREARPVSESELRFAAKQAVVTGRQRADVQRAAFGLLDAYRTDSPLERQSARAQAMAALLALEEF